jgi:hypothetical protein
MDGYELITNDEKHLGHVVERRGTNAIVEHGLLRKTRHAVPETFLDVHDDERIVRTTLSKQLIEDSPKVSADADVDEAEIAAYYGLAGGDPTAPATEGYGALNPDDPATLNPGIAAAEQERVDVLRGREGDTYGSPGRQVIPPSPHEVGGREYDERT